MRWSRDCSVVRAVVSMTRYGFRKPYRGGKAGEVGIGLQSGDFPCVRVSHSRHTQLFRTAGTLGRTVVGGADVAAIIL